MRLRGKGIDDSCARNSMERETVFADSTIRLLAASVFLWTAAIPDLRTKRIPVWIPAVFLLAAAVWDMFLPYGLATDLLTFSGSALEQTGVAAGWLTPLSLDRRELWAGAVPGAVLLLLSFLSRGKIGEGDGICLLVCGLFVGITQTVWILELALLFTAAAGAALLLTKRLRADDQIPFLPFLAAASIILLLCGR